MGKNRTEKSRYPSKYSGGWVTGPQYIIEQICERKAQRERTDLPIKFWNLPEWANYYKSQLRACYSLIKKYSEKAIINMLTNNKGCFSLRPKWVETLIENEFKCIKMQEKLFKNEPLKVDRKENKTHSKHKVKDPFKGLN